MVATADRADPAVRTPDARRPRRAVVVVTSACILAATLVAVLATRPRPAGPDVAPGIDRASASVLSLDVLGRTSVHPAPGFSLTDQHGDSVGPARFRGQSVVLSFNDDRCPDLCTLLAQAIAVAHRDLPGGHVVFLSVNVNPFFPQVGTVRQWTHDHGLDAVAGWHFATAPATDLEEVWRAYGVYVQGDPRTETVVHGSQLFFIDPRGQVRAVGDSGLDAANTSYFAHAMAQMAVDLLPPAERYHVGGPVTPPGVRGAISPGAPAPDFLLPRLGAATGTVTLERLSGRPTVVTFWSPTCASCATELAALQAVHRDLGAEVNVVGIDVADGAGAGSRLASASGVTFPLAADRDGAVASTYGISSLPDSYVLSPQGTFDVIHPGTFTTEQVEYVLKTLYPRLSVPAARSRRSTS